MIKLLQNKHGIKSESYRYTGRWLSMEKIWTEGDSQFQFSKVNLFTNYLVKFSCPFSLSVISILISTVLH